MFHEAEVEAASRRVGVEDNKGREMQELSTTPGRAKVSRNGITITCIIIILILIILIVTILNRVASVGTVVR